MFTLGDVNFQAEAGTDDFVGRCFVNTAGIINTCINTSHVTTWWNHTGTTIATSHIADFDPWVVECCAGAVVINLNTTFFDLLWHKARRRIKDREAVADQLAVIDQ